MGGGGGRGRRGEKAGRRGWVGPAGLSGSALGWRPVRSDQDPVSSQAAGRVLGILFNLILENQNKDFILHIEIME